MAASDWNSFSVEHWRGPVLQALPLLLLLANPKEKDDNNTLSRGGRTTTLRGGSARGPLVGGNLAVLSSMAGSPYPPRF